MSSVTKYKCLLTRGEYNYHVNPELIEIGVFRGDGDSIKPTYTTFDATPEGITNAVFETNGLFSPDATFIVSGTDNRFESLGLNCIHVVSGEFAHFTFSNGNSIRVFSGYNIRYTIPQVGFRNLSQSSASDSLLANSFTDDIIHEYDYNNVHYTGLTVQSLRISASYSTVSLPSIYYGEYPKFSQFAYYASNESESTQTARQEIISFIQNFWRGIDENVNYIYYGLVTFGSGGTVSPGSFFASPNEPRMFTVTPDQHHAIHSVTINNLDTGALIPYQESGMDLQTGAKNYIFTMPRANVQITVTFHSLELSIPVIVKYTSPASGKLYTTSFNLLYDSPREETNATSEGGTQNAG